MALFKPAHLFRALRPNETALARDVFHKTLPPLNTVGITNGLGDGNSIWTLDKWSFDVLQSGPPKSLDQLKYLINFGEAVHWDLSTKKSLNSVVPKYPFLASNVFVHEMTHVWQFHRGNRVKSRSIYANWFGAGEKFTAGDPWMEYNVEQQAYLVESWNRDRVGPGEDHELFPYIHYIIRKEGEYKSTIKMAGVEIDELWTMDLAKLTALLTQERGLGRDDPGLRPIQISVTDDSLMVVLDGGVLFDFDKSMIKPEANGLLARAAAAIKSKSGPRLKSILINGHTDSAGDAAYNMRLSEQRAKTVADWFFSRGHLSRSNTVTQGFGKTDPVAPNTDAAGRAKNRRVEIYLMNN